VLNLLADLKTRGLGIVFITHDLSLGNYISETTLILYRGQVVERGPTEKVFGNPLHPYTRRLVISVPQLHQKWSDVEAEFEAPSSGPDGTCLFHAAYPPNGSKANGNGSRPSLVEADEGHFVACFDVEGGGACTAEEDAALSGLETR
jgi:peptide/nickel transport system ATP-binding protein